MKVPFFRLKLGAAERKAVAEVVRSNWLSSGPKVKQFEKETARLFGANFAAAVSSGTAGLHLAILANGIGRGDEVITTPMTMAATVEAILYTGARPVLADIDPVTLNIDPYAIEKKISKKTKVIIPVDLAGLPCDYRRIGKLARKHGLKIIADAAHSFGAEYRGKKIGTLADCTVFSFYPTKNITTGEGGMVLSRNKMVHDRIKRLSLHAMDSSGWKRARGGSWRYDINALGYKYNMAELPAALGLAQLGRYESLMRKRENLAQRYDIRLMDLSDYIEIPPVPEEARQARHLYIVKLNLSRWKIGRDRLVEELEKRGIGCGVHYIPIYHFSYYKKVLNYYPKDYSIAENSFKRIISLPFYPDLKNREVDYVCDTLRKLSQKYSR